MWPMTRGFSIASRQRRRRPRRRLEAFGDLAGVIDIKAIDRRIEPRIGTAGDAVEILNAEQFKGVGPRHCFFCHCAPTDSVNDNTAPRADGQAYVPVSCLNIRLLCGFIYTISVSFYISC